MKEHKEENLIYKYAKHYTQVLGWSIIPLHNLNKDKTCTCSRSDCGKSRGKHPRTPHGIADASKDLNVIDAWFKEWPDCNIGILTGKINNFFVLDADGLEGKRSIFNLPYNLPYTANSTTGEGIHYLFNYPKDIELTNRVGFIKGLDIRSSGGFIVGCPSFHYSGKRYRWVDDDYIADAPQWLIDLILNPPDTEPKEVFNKQKTTFDFKGKILYKDFYGASAMQDEMNTLWSTKEGRNNQLFKSSACLYELVAGGVLEEDMVYSALYDAAISIGLGTSETKTTINSGKRKGLNNPRGNI